MNELTKNPNIRCSVSQCRYHVTSEDFCGLDRIRVGTHDPDPTGPSCVDCNSFVRRSDPVA